MDPMQQENVVQLAFLDILFQFVDLIFGLLTNVLIPAVLTPVFQGFFGLFTDGTGM